MGPDRAAEIRQRPGRPKAEVLEELCAGLVESLRTAAGELDVAKLEPQASEATRRAAEAEYLLRKIVDKGEADDGR